MTSYAPPLSLQVASLRVPEAIATATLTLAGDNRDAASHELLLHPDETGEIAIYLENHTQHSLRWFLEMKGNCPANWCQWQPEDSILPARGKLERTIPFRVPADFFENDGALSGDRSTLQIDYYSEVLVYVRRVDEENLCYLPQLTKHQRFTLNIRPTSSYLNFLPALYREVDFVGRFLAIIEQAFDPAVQTMDTLWAYFDPLTAPEALLPFLAHWVGWTNETYWNTAQQRRLIRNAVTLYRWHGTRRGLQYYLHLYTGLPLEPRPGSTESIRIEEVFSDGFFMGNTHIGQDSMLGGGKPYHFIVWLRCDRPETINEIQVRRIIEQQKPAFCTYDFHIVSSTVI